MSVCVCGCVCRVCETPECVCAWVFAYVHVKMCHTCLCVHVYARLHVCDRVSLTTTHMRACSYYTHTRTPGVRVSVSEQARMCLTVREQASAEGEREQCTSPDVIGVAPDGCLCQTRFVHPVTHVPSH